MQALGAAKEQQLLQQGPRSKRGKRAAGKPKAGTEAEALAIDLAADSDAAEDLAADLDAAENADGIYKDADHETAMTVSSGRLGNVRKSSAACGVSTPGPSGARMYAGAGTSGLRPDSDCGENEEADEPPESIDVDDEAVMRRLEKGKWSMRKRSRKKQRLDGPGGKDADMQAGAGAGAKRAAAATAGGVHSAQVNADAELAALLASQDADQVAALHAATLRGQHADQRLQAASKPGTSSMSPPVGIPSQAGRYTAIGRPGPGQGGQLGAGTSHGSAYIGAYGPASSAGAERNADGNHGSLAPAGARPAMSVDFMHGPASMDLSGMSKEDAAAVAAALQEDLDREAALAAATAPEDDTSTHHIDGAGHDSWEDAMCMDPTAFMHRDGNGDLVMQDADVDVYRRQVDPESLRRRLLAGSAGAAGIKPAIQSGAALQGAQPAAGQPAGRSLSVPAGAGVAAAGRGGGHSGHGSASVDARAGSSLAGTGSSALVLAANPAAVESEEDDEDGDEDGERITWTCSTAAHRAT